MSDEQPILLTCPSCKVRVRIPVSYAGHVAHCPECSAGFFVPDMEGAGLDKPRPPGLERYEVPPQEIVVVPGKLPTKPQLRYHRYPGGRWLYVIFMAIGLSLIVVGIGLLIDGLKNLPLAMAGLNVIFGGLLSLALGWLIGYFSGREDREEYLASLEQYRRAQLKMKAEA